MLAIANLGEIRFSFVPLASIGLLFRLLLLLLRLLLSLIELLRSLLGECVHHLLGFTHKSILLNVARNATGPRLFSCRYNGLPESFKVLHDGVIVIAASLS